MGEWLLRDLTKQEWAHRAPVKAYVLYEAIPKAESYSLLRILQKATTYKPFCSKSQ